MRETTPAQRTVAATAALLLIAMFFSVGGLTGAWWLGSFEVSVGRVTAEVEFVSTLWKMKTKTTFRGQSKEDEADIDEICGKDELTDEGKSQCGKIRATRAFVFLELVMCLVAMACSMVWLRLSALENVSGTKRPGKWCLVGGLSCSLFALLWSLLAVIVASTLDFKDKSNDIGVGGAGFVLTILALVFWLIPSIFLVALVLFWDYRAPAVASTATATVPPKVADLPNLVTPRTEGLESKEKCADIEAAVVGCGTV